MHPPLHQERGEFDPNLPRRCASSSVIIFEGGSGNGVSLRRGSPGAASHQDGAFAAPDDVACHCLGLGISVAGGQREGGGGSRAVDADVGGEQAAVARGVPAGSAQAEGAAAAGEAEAASSLARAGVRRRPARPLHRVPVAAPQEADPGVVMLRSGRNLPPAYRLGRFLGEFFRVLGFLFLSVFSFFFSFFPWVIASLVSTPMVKIISPGINNVLFFFSVFFFFFFFCCVRVRELEFVALELKILVFLNGSSS